MNNAQINQSGINGSSIAAWVIYGAVLATASATIASCDAVHTRAGRTTPAIASAAVVTAAPVVLKPGNSLKTAGATGLAQPNITYSGACNVVGSATGMALVPNAVDGAATGTATATGTAIAAQALGESLASCAATAVQIDAHIIHPGGSVATAIASGVAADGGVTRYALVSGVCDVTYTRAEASLKLSANSFYSHDGYVTASTGCLALIDQTLTGLTVTGVTGIDSTCNASAAAFVIQAGACYAEALSIDGATIIEILHKKYGLVTAVAAATGTAAGVKNRPTGGAGTASSVCLSAKTLVKYAASVTSAQGDAVQGGATPTRMRAGAVNGDMASAALVSSEFGNQFFAEAVAGAAVSELVTPIQMHKAFASSSANNMSIKATMTIIQMASVNETMATALNIKATGMTNSDVMAPDERYMTVQSDDRIMIVPFEERTLLVAV